MPVAASLVSALFTIFRCAHLRPRVPPPGSHDELRSDERSPRRCRLRPRSFPSATAFSKTRRGHLHGGNRRASAHRLFCSRDRLRPLKTTNSQPPHLRDQGSPCQAQPGSCAIAAAYYTLGLLESVKNVRALRILQGHSP